MLHLKYAGILTLLTLLPKETWWAVAFEVVYHLNWVTGPSILARIELARGLGRNKNLTLMRVTEVWVPKGSELLWYPHKARQAEGENSEMS